MEIKLTKYVKLGRWQVLRSSLPSNHLESDYQQIKKLGKKPEDYKIGLKKE